MTTATRKRTTRRQTLIEYATSAGAVFDRKAGIIRGVKILGKESKNGRTYSPRALQDAARLYEGVPVYVDHPDRDDPCADRSVADKLDHLTNIKIREGGVYGDLVFLTSHPLANQIIETAERMPEHIGLSHNADGELTREGDRVIVQRVLDVRSVDLVSRPASTGGLFESLQKGKRAMRNRIKALLTEIIGDEGLTDEDGIDTAMLNIDLADEIRQILADNEDPISLKAALKELVARMSEIDEDEEDEEEEEEDEDVVLAKTTESFVEALHTPYYGKTRRPKKRYERLGKFETDQADFIRAITR